MAEENPQDPPPQPRPTMTQGKPIPKHMASTPATGNARRTLCSCTTVFLLLAGITVLTIWLIYRPYKPRFNVVGAAIYDLNISSPPFVSTSMQFTILTRNPNKRVSIFYDRLTAYVSNRNQQITLPVDLPPLFQETKSTVALSPVLGGFRVPVSAEVVNGLGMDESYGVVALKVVLIGSLRWKAGAIRTAKYAVYVRCNVMVGLKKGLVGQAPLLDAPPCKVDI
ncbi:hypothetical protein SLEP1_g2185 [Rubroshorea leprosula]|uniref:Late embryogenesis abundant protein LEA-2 subgroup domain-containing protein n=1 Tax=Rubroshorea leprosula TaxID=152421 RepID=A0AAV5HMW6_9ROSI|nr:hypothetical protein SLEP1_g2185 [Rubroshorea leprosula]